MRGVLSCLVVIAVALVPARADAKWTQIRSSNFLFIGDASESQIRRIAQKLEEFREVMTRALPGATAASPVPTVVIVFADARSLKPVAPLFKGSVVEVAGYFQSGEDLNYIALDGEFPDTALLAIFHEYSHFLVSNSVGPLPPWAGEGLAEVYQLVQERDGGKKAIVGLAPKQHVELLQNTTLIPMRELIAIDHTSPVYNEGSRRTVFYAESWALVHYLSFGNPARSKQFSQFLSSMRTGGEAAAAFAEAFGADSAALDRELFEYVRRYAYPGIEFDFGQKVTAAGSVQKGTALSDLDADIYIGDLQGRIGRQDESRARLAGILKRKPDAARATAALGMQQFRDGNIDTALPLLERAATQGSDDAWVQNAYGRALVAQLGDRRDASETKVTLQRARAVLGRAVELDPDSAYASAMLGYVELALDEDRSRATSLLERAVKLAPSREQYRVFLAEALARQRDFTKATAYLGPLMGSARSPQIRSQARELLGRVATMRNRPADAATVAPTADALTTLANLSRISEIEPPTIPIEPGTAGIPGSISTLAAPARETFRPDLRPIAAGETRTLGRFRAIECTQAGIVLIVDTDTGPLRLRAKQLSDVDFISYRSDAPGGVSCGPLPAAQRVLATFRAGAAGTGTSATQGDAVAIELLPDGYTPR